MWDWKYSYDLFFFFKKIQSAIETCEDIGLLRAENLGRKVLEEVCFKMEIKKHNILTGLYKSSLNTLYPQTLLPQGNSLAFGSYEIR